jgi:hypothetical protein
MPWLATRRSRGPRCTALAAPLVAAIVLAGCGGGESTVSDQELVASYKQTVPDAFESYVEALQEGDSDRVCEELFAPRSVKAIEAESGQPCSLAVTDNSSNLSGSDEVELEDVKLAESRRAQVFYSLDGRSSGPITFAPVGGEWKVVYEANPAVVREREYLERKQRKLESKANGH